MHTPSTVAATEDLSVVDLHEHDASGLHTPPHTASTRRRTSGQVASRGSVGTIGYDDDTEDDASAEEPRGLRIVQHRPSCPRDLPCALLVLAALGAWLYLTHYLMAQRGGSLDASGRHVDFEGSVCGSGGAAAAPHLTPVLQGVAVCSAGCPQEGGRVCSVGGVCFTVTATETGVNYTSASLLYRCHPTHNTTNLPLEFPGCLVREMRHAWMLTMTAGALTCATSAVFLLFLRMRPRPTLYFALFGNVGLLVGLLVKLFSLWTTYADGYRRLSFIFGGAVAAILLLLVLYVGLLLYCLAYGRDEINMLLDLLRIASAFVMPCGSASGSVVPFATVVGSSVLTFLSYILFFVNMLLAFGLSTPKPDTPFVYNSVSHSAATTELDTPAVYYAHIVNFVAMCVVTSFIKNVAACMLSVQLSSWYTSETMLSGVPKSIVHGSGLWISLRYHSGSCSLHAWAQLLLRIPFALGKATCAGLGPVLLYPAVYVPSALHGTGLLSSAATLSALLVSLSRTEVQNGVSALKLLELSWFLTTCFVSLVSTVAAWHALFATSTQDEMALGVGVLAMLALGCFVVADAALSPVSAIPAGLFVLYALDTQQQEGCAQHFVPPVFAAFVDRYAPELPDADATEESATAMSDCGDGCGDGGSSRADSALPGSRYSVTPAKHAWGEGRGSGRLDNES